MSFVFSSGPDNLLLYQKFEFPLRHGVGQSGLTIPTIVVNSYSNEIVAEGMAGILNY